MGRSQVVRQRLLMPCTVGSIPTAPAKQTAQGLLRLVVISSLVCHFTA